MPVLLQHHILDSKARNRTKGPLSLNLQQHILDSKTLNRIKNPLSFKCNLQQHILDSKTQNRFSGPLSSNQQLLTSAPDVSVALPERGRLTPDQAIYIFLQKETKSSRTAALLAAKYGVTPKAIHDIWRHRTWAHNTWPHWT